MIGLLTLWTAVALAEDPQGVPMDLDGFRPSVDAQAAWAVDGTLNQEVATGSVSLGYARDMGAFCAFGETDCYPLVRDLTALYLTGQLQVGWFSFGGVATMHPYVGGRLQPGGGGPGLGDASLELRVTPLRTARWRPGVALVGRAGLPFGGHHRFVGRRGVTGEVGLISDVMLGPVWVALNAGVRFGPRSYVGEALVPEDQDLWVDDHVVGGAALGWVSDRGGLTVETWARMDLGPWSPPEVQSGTGGCARPQRSVVEGRVGGWVALRSNLRLRAGVGRGLTCALGASAVRAELGLSFHGVEKPRRTQEQDEVEP